MNGFINFTFRLMDKLWNWILVFRSNYDENKVPVYTLPDPFKLANGVFVTRPKEWIKKRRPEIICLFQKHIYGRSPQMTQSVHFCQTSYESKALDGIATRKEITLFLIDKLKAYHIHLLIYLPNFSSKPVPAFLGLNFYGNHTIHPDPGISITKQWQQLNKYTPPVLVLPSSKTRGTKYSRWPVEKILQRGYALVTVYYGDLEPDFVEGWRYGIRTVFHSQPQPKELSFQTQEVTTGQTNEKELASSWIGNENWGAIGVWAWGLSRILDYLDQDSEIRELQVALLGHSRLGKAALWAGAQDERFAIVISNNSGCGGAALSRRRYGETIKLINHKFPQWFCKKFKKYNGKETQLPIDQHMLIALMVPRPVYIASAEQDLEADPLGEFLSAKHADPVYNLFGLIGLGKEQMPCLNEPIGKAIGYHIRSGKHDITDYDWDQYLHFADRHFGKTSP